MKAGLKIETKIEASSSTEMIHTHFVMMLKMSQEYLILPYLNDKGK